MATSPSPPSRSSSSSSSSSSSHHRNRRLGGMARFGRAWKRLLGLECPSKKARSSCCWWQRSQRRRSPSPTANDAAIVLQEDLPTEEFQLDEDWSSHRDPSEGVRVNLIPDYDDDDDRDYDEDSSEVEEGLFQEVNVNTKEDNEEVEVEAVHGEDEEEGSRATTADAAAETVTEPPSSLEIPSRLTFSPSFETIIDTASVAFQRNIARYGVFPIDDEAHNSSSSSDDIYLPPARSPEMERLQIIHQLFDHYPRVRSTPPAALRGSCRVCLEPLVEGQNDRDETTNNREPALSSVLSGREVLELILCQHAFHRRCIRSWAEHRDECPICRQSMWTYQMYEEAHRQIRRRAAATQRRYGDVLSQWSDNSHQFVSSSDDDSASFGDWMMRQTPPYFGGGTRDSTNRTTAAAATAAATETEPDDTNATVVMDAADDVAGSAESTQNARRPSTETETRRRQQLRQQQLEQQHLRAEDTPNPGDYDGYFIGC